MYDVVEGALRETRIDIAEGHQSGACHSAREGHCVSFGDAHVEGAVGHLLHHAGQSAACGHGWRDSHYAAVLPCQLHQRLAEYVLVFGRQSAGVGMQAFACFRVIASRGMVECGVLLGGLKSLALDGVYVQQLRSLHVLDLRQCVDQLNHVVAVAWPEVSDVHALKDVLLIGEQ